MDGKVERWLNEWYCKCRNKFIDLGNFGGGELFVIEGDSLLFKFLYDPDADFIDFSQPFGGGQFLSLTFLIENFLKKLREREFVFHIVFFDVNQSIWNNRPKLRLAREIIIDHLKSHCAETQIYNFENWWNKKWKEYLDSKQPLFILTGDGSTENLKIKKNNNYVEEIDDYYVEEIDDSSISGIATKNSLNLTVVLRAFIFFSLHMDMPVALLPGLEFKNAHVHSFLIERSGNVDLKSLKKLDDVENFTIKAFSIYDEKSKWFKGSVEKFDLITPIKDLLTSEECLDVWSNGGKRIALVLLSLTGVLTNNSDKPYFHYLAKIFLLHLILLDYLPLKSRVIPPINDDDDVCTEAKTRVDLFLQDVYTYCAKIYVSDIYLEEMKNFQDLYNNLYDLLDARLFVSLIQFQCDGLLNFNNLPTEIKQQFDACWNLLKRLCECNGLNSLDSDNEKYKKKFRIESYQKSDLEYDKKPSLLPFEYEFFKECLGDMNLKLPEDPDSEANINVPRYGLIEEIDYNESTYNISLKIPKKGPKVIKSAAYYEKHKNSLGRKGYQQYVRFLEEYATSLNGTQGYYTQKIIVDRTRSSSKSKSKSTSKSVQNQKSAKKEATGTKKAREKIEQETLKQSRSASDKYLDDALNEISKDGNIKNQLNSLNTKLEKTDKIKHPFTMLRGQFKKLEFLFKLWTEHCMNSQVKKDWSIPIDILHQVFYIAQNKNFQPYLDDKMKKILVEVLSRLKLNDCKKRLKKLTTTESKEKLFKFDFPSEWTDLSIGMSDARFQMIHAGHLMDRNTNSVDDPRVPHFKPDAWQVEVLDVIDKEESALLCCPTSSGKTFISYYAMDKVLRESDDGILVYVSPTKALVNQVTAEVYGRFEKSYDHGDKTTWGIYTREYRENHDKCQILITIPQMLETLIFSPQRASWARNIKRIIFDEIHMIGSEGGEFYDRLLLLSKSIPILALSATVGNPEPFNKWIAKSKEVRKQKMKLIITKKRFSDLQQYVYLPKFPLTSLIETSVYPKENQRQTKSIIPINPIFSLSMSILKESGFPGDMKLVPSQCVQLWDVMKKYAGDNPPNGLKELDPDIYFKDIGYIVKDDADGYEEKLKEVFMSYVKDESLNHIVKSTIDELGNDIKNGFTELESTANTTRCVQLFDVIKKYLGDNPSNELDELNPNIYFKDINHVARDDVDKYEQKLKRVFIKCVQPWDVLKGRVSDNPPDELGKLEPSIYFKNIDHIARKDVDEYEQTLKLTFKDNETVESDIEELGSYIKNGFAKFALTSSDLSKQYDVYGDKFLEEGIVPLLCELSAQEKLPAILFHFDEKGCEDLAFHILKQLESAEKEKRDNDPEYQARKKATMSRKEIYEKDSKRKRDKKSSAPDEDAEVEEQIPTFFDWEAHDPNFTFVNQKGRVTSEEFEELTEQLEKTNDNHSKLLLAALERGIGIHHTDLPRKYLSAVEILFRRRYLQVVIATGTLALGINMPCKTTVFVGDSISLTALQYRQMSGRSGRRGFDPLGHVVFFGLTHTKIVRLLMSRLPNLSRHFPLTTTLTLRSFNLLNSCKARNADDYNYAKDTIKGLFGESFFFLGKEFLPEQIKYQLRFSVEYLRHESFLNSEGKLINLSAVTSHLNYNEPSNFAFAILFMHGVFHRICSESRTNEEIMNNLVLVLSHLFNRVKLRKFSGDWYKNDETPSKVILPPLSKNIKKVLEQHNERILEIYADYAVTYAKNNASRMGLDNILPFSSIKIPSKSLDQNSLKDPLISKFESTAISFIARSPFIAMCSSLGDIFNNLEDLTNHLHSEIYLDLHSIPYIKTDETLNAYINDFFSHGQEKALVEANGIRRGEVWRVLNEFYGVISSIVIALRNRNFSDGLEDKEEQLLKGFEMVLEHFSEKFEKTFV
ncbi:hypothetical protein RclHR1_13130004 [Rhizophagus clarus]|uniref:P-loop containing nucleoside triphosphate hydrolase protein n=1 Tax=Rhizophagus clarus TaxID=94130 RepID=A0A2Z6R1N2_9GLOM|nr:hypothetical protein RclHR1_13130004 [Rhizophagus clarus]GET03308.1 P-loop containing nucleoside triphosphate hydrolase protein [Rhizophagus clarus]